MDVITDGGGRTSDAGNEHVNADAVRERWRAMDGEARAFLVYCLLRLRQHLGEGMPQQREECASGRETTGTTKNMVDGGTSSCQDSV